MTNNITPKSDEPFKPSVLLNRQFQDRFLRSVEALLVQENDWQSKTQFSEADSIGFEGVLLKYLAVPSEHLLRTSLQAQERLADLHDDIIDATNRYLLQLNWFRAQPYLGTIYKRMQSETMRELQTDLTPYSRDDLLQERIHDVISETIETLAQMRALFNEQTKHNRRETGGCSPHVIWNADDESYSEMDYQDFLYEMENIFLEVHHWPLGLYPLFPQDHALMKDKADSDEHLLMRMAHIESGHIELLFPGKKLSGRDLYLKENLSDKQRTEIDQKVANARSVHAVLNIRPDKDSGELPQADILKFRRPK
ncbi:MAG TPA: hypothetical protein DHW10_01630 [Rhodospirillaceae bacterium]|nr:hypothetical protein [Rhodospirillaceae bacterium]